MSGLGEVIGFLLFLIATGTLGFLVRRKLDAQEREAALREVDGDAPTAPDERDEDAQ